MKPAILGEMSTNNKRILKSRSD